MSLDDLRDQLDTIDNKMMSLLSQRADVILRVAALKKRDNLPAHVPEREAAIMQRLRDQNSGPLTDDAVERIYRLIVEEMRNFEAEHMVHGTS